MTGPDQSDSISEVHPTPHSGGECKLVWTESSPLAAPRPLQQGAMLDRLHEIEAILPELLKDSNSWRTLDVDHCTPKVERVFQKVGELWVALHCIYPCEREEALLHPHPWPSAMRILSGKYEMGVGYGEGNEMPPLAGVVVLPQDSEYEMGDPNSWHYVRPVDEPTMTIMVTGEKWERSAPKNAEKLNELSNDRKEEILDFFRRCYS